MMSKIENYIFGKLNQKEINDLWIELLKEPKWMTMLETEVIVKYVAFQEN